VAAARRVAAGRSPRLRLLLLGWCQCRSAAQALDGVPKIRSKQQRSLRVAGVPPELLHSLFSLHEEPLQLILIRRGAAGRAAQLLLSGLLHLHGRVLQRCLVGRARPEGSSGCGCAPKGS
jgi:hypothetical protein